MRAPADIAVYDENDQISTLVEVRAVPKTTPEWAIESRRDIVGRSGFTPKCFLVVARDFTYIWTVAASPENPPNKVVPTNELFKKYLHQLDSNGQSISPGSLELMVGIWLSDLAQLGERSLPANLTGLSSAVANGRVEFLVAA
jgi:hypothetical protein